MVQKPAHAASGFTLIELSIVLVIIGLIVGGILVGKDLIRAAEIRMTVAQIEKYNAAVNTFRSKYGGLPGDLAVADATSFGLFTVTGAIAGSPGYGDNDGLIQNLHVIGIGQESHLFWRQLSDAKLIDGAYGSNGQGAIDPATGFLVGGYNGNAGILEDIALADPPAKLGGSMFFFVYNDGKHNYYALRPVNFIDDFGNGESNNAQLGISPMNAYAIDMKLDDGAPNTGIVTARPTDEVNIFDPNPFLAETQATWASPAASGACLTGGVGAYDSAAIYNTNANAGGGDTSCALQIRFN